MSNHPQSDALWARAQKVLAGGPATLSKHPRRFPQGIAPAFLFDGDGPYIWDVDGNRYIDTVAALGPILLGHNHRHVTCSVWEQAERLTSSTLSTALEVEVAEMLVDLIPGAEMCRFAMNGADATNAAVKLARYITGKRHMIFCGYHGGHDSYLITTDKAGGILPRIAPYNHQVPWGDLPALSWALAEAEGDLAGLMLEVPPVAYGTPDDDVTMLLETYKVTAQHQGALVLVDEVVTFPRYGLQGAQGYYRVTGDITCVSKAIANGYPCSAILGPRALMQAFTDGTVFHSSTFGANPVSLAACKATLEYLQVSGVHEGLVSAGGSAVRLIHTLLTDTGLPATVRGNFARWVIDWHDSPGIATAAEWYTLWLQELAKHGVLANIPWFSMTCWTRETVGELLEAVGAAAYVMTRVRRGEVGIGDALECPVIQRSSAVRHQ